MSTVAAFDVDGTLTVRDCVLPFMLRVAGVSPLLSATARAMPALVSRRRDEVKAHFCRKVFAGRAVTEVDLVAQQFADKVAGSWLRRDTLARLRWHQEMGHDVVLVSASLRPYLAHLASHLGVDHLMCTDLEQADGVYTGELEGPNCRGAEKVARLEAWAARRGQSRDSQWLTYAYGDSAGDSAMLTLATTAHKVGRGELARSC